MKMLVRISFILVMVLSVVSLTSCSKSSYPGHASKASKHHGAITASAASPKKEPLRKKYIVPNKKRRVLGTDYH